MDPSQSTYGPRHSAFGRPREPRNSSLPPRHCPPSSLSTSHTQQSPFDVVASSRREPSNAFSRHPPAPAAPPSLGYPYSRDVISHTQQQHQQHAHHPHNNGAPRQRTDAATREPRIKHSAEEGKGQAGMNMRREAVDHDAQASLRLPLLPSFFCRPRSAVPPFGLLARFTPVARRPRSYETCLIRRSTTRLAGGLWEALAARLLIQVSLKPNATTARPREKYPHRRPFPDQEPRSLAHEDGSQLFIGHGTVFIHPDALPFPRFLPSHVTFGREHPAATASTTYPSRQMLPPSSPQHYPPRGPAIQHPQPPSAPPPSSSFASRELAITSQAHRPGSSMSISSMLGSDTDRLPRENIPGPLYSRPSVTSIPAATAPPPPPPAQPPSMSPPSALTRQPSSEYPSFRRSHTPDGGPFSKPLTPRPYRSRSGGSASGNPPPVTDDSRFGGPRPASNAPQPQYSEKQPSAPRSPRNTYPESSYHQDRRMSLGGPIPRANPQGHQQHRSEEPPSRPPLFSPPVRLAPGFVEGAQKESNTQREQHGYPGNLEAPPPRPSSRFSDPSQDRQEHGGRDQQPYRQHGIQEHAHHQQQSQSQQHQHQPHRYGPHVSEHEGDRSQRGPWESNYQRVSPESTRYNAGETNTGYGFGSIQNYTKSLGSQLTAPRSIPGQTPLHPRQDATPSNDSSPHISRNRPPTQNPPRLFSPTPASTSAQSFNSSFADEQRARGATEEPPHHKSVLNINAETRRGGRASPLPQAVQGAQAQIIDPATESGIKSELGRVFSGIGSGVGVSSSASLGGSGPSTPMASSPFKKDHGGRSMNQDLNGENSFGKGPGSAPGSGRRGRRVKEEEGKDETEAAVVPRGGGGRRARHVHHHHHHGHHPALVMLRLHLQQRVPHTITTTITITTIMAHAQHLAVAYRIITIQLLPPFRSTLYAPRIEMPSARAPPESSKFGYTSTPIPIPRFDGKENCTFTIRVPRFRIDSSHREEICARRALWGTGVYTDDSDPVAAAIHSGFIRGEWAEDVDVSMLNLEIKDNRRSQPAATTNGHGSAVAKPASSNGNTPSANSNSTKSDPASTAQSETPQQPPAASTTPGTSESKQLPPVPPPKKDLHIKLLILPTLERYDSSVMYGLKSRSWGKNHDGMSFKVLEIEWVDEGASKGEERGGEARRKRLRNMMRSGRICTPAGLKGRKGVELHLSSNRDPDPDTTMKDADEASPAVPASTAVEPVS
ncbi:uncharacterized protein GIQ15_05842 [Arthroderma uncinatum]|uniref:uncharacterized protein n=1 Tax=Arthroderma uncinatum TaxID=74035 RepID=UPI00144AE610|nr:uncharacterized protein GIQ15_05842 [Arthroderma uncinatum]KAF3480495.1 hypothetical protein GIQ15_05842 [Arthroderma uncinatum]